MHCAQQVNFLASLAAFEVGVIALAIIVALLAWGDRRDREKQ